MNLPASSLGKSQSTSTIEFRAKSLHFNQRKAELERIERENQKIAKKIFCLKSDLNKNNFSRDFGRHEAIKNNLARIKKKKVPDFNGRHGALPPLDDDAQVRQGSAPMGGQQIQAQQLHGSQSSSDYNTVGYGGAEKNGKR